MTIEVEKSTNQLPYFTPLLPWQTALWHHLVSTSLEKNNRLPHALLASGMSGIGKRAFIWHWIAWQLCHNRQYNHQSACGDCESCQWLKSGTHPDLRVLPNSSSPTFGMTAEPESNRKTKSTSKTSKKSTKDSPTTIKIDDIRGIHDFVQQGSIGMRICVFDHAETMTIAAANALLKTLEEPRQGIQLILITDKPSLLLPTIKSRVQQLPLNKIDPLQSQSYVQNQLPQADTTQVAQLLKLSNHAPLQAVNMAVSKWYPLRKLWLKTWLALKLQSRTPTTASDYWQSQLGLSDFLTLTQVMLADLQRLSCNLPTYQQDIDFSVINAENIPNIDNLNNIHQILKTINTGQKQNVQDKLAYDMLMHEVSQL